MAEQNARLSANEPGVEAEIKQRTFAVLYLYERPYEKDEAEEEAWLGLMAKSAADVLGIPLEHIVKKSRGPKSHKSTGSLSPSKGQYQARHAELVSASPEERSRNEFGMTSQIGMTIQGIVQEQGQLFRVDLTTYLDTGLFFDHRVLRSTVRDTCSKKRVLNLFCYTSSFSVYAAQGNAAYVESVDLSNTYLDWSKENMKLNGFSDKNRYVFTRADCIRFLQEKAVAAKSGQLKAEELYDLIILDPPTFSNSKNTNDVLDINRDWPQLVKDCHGPNNLSFQVFLCLQIGLPDGANLGAGFFLRAGAASLETFGNCALTDRAEVVAIDGFGPVHATTFAVDVFRQDGHIIQFRPTLCRFLTQSLVVILRGDIRVTFFAVKAADGDKILHGRAFSFIIQKYAFFLEIIPEGGSQGSIVIGYIA